MIRLLHTFLSLLTALLGFCIFSLFVHEHYVFGVIATALVMYIDFVQCTVVKTHMEHQRWTN